MKANLTVLITSACILMLGACQYKQLPEPEPPDICDTMEVTYEEDMKPIIDNSCAYSGCHDGAGGIGPFDYTTYEGLSNAFDNMRTRVIELKDDPAQGMPPDSEVYPNSRKDDLTEEELQLFECWIEAGFPRN